MYKITIKTDNSKNSAEVIRANFWLAYHTLNSLYGVEDSNIDEAFNTAEKEPCEIRFNNKTFTVERQDMSVEQMYNDLHLSVSVLTPEISTAEDEDRQYIKLERGFVINLQKVLSRILKTCEVKNVWTRTRNDRNLNTGNCRKMSTLVAGV